MSGRGRSELARFDRRPLHPLDGRREVPDKRRVIIRSPDGAVRSVRAIALLSSFAGLKAVVVYAVKVPVTNIRLEVYSKRHVIFSS